MNVSLYQAAAAMNANERWQEVVAENLATNSAPGARKSQVSFKAVEAGLAQGLQSPGGSRHLLPACVTTTNFQQGPLRPSGVQTDVALEGPGFLEVQLPNGASGYTRDGELHLNAHSQVVTKQGYLVLSDTGPLQLDPNNSSPLSIAASGEVSQGSESKGRLHLVEFNDPGLLRSMGGGCFLADNPNLQPTPAQATQVRQGFLEYANSSPTTEMASLLTAMRMFEANQKVMQAQDDRMGRVISELGSPS